MTHKALVRLKDWRFAAGLVALSIGAAWVISSTGAGVHSTPRKETPALSRGAGSVKAGTAGPATALPPVPTGVTAQADTLPEGPKVSRDARITLQVNRGQFDSKLDQLFGLVAEQGGYVAGSSAESTEGELRSGLVTFKVPAAKFEATVERVRRLGSVQVLDIGGTDVSQEYVDLQARLRSLEAERDATMALLHQATSIQDIMTIQQQLGREQSEIEQVQGRINYLDHAVAYSTFSVTVRESGAPAATGDDWGLRTALVQAGHNFVSAIDFAIVAAGTMGPALLLLAGCVLLFWRRRSRPAAAL